MYQISSALPDHDAVGIGIRLHGGDDLREPTERDISRDDAGEPLLFVLQRHTVGNDHLLGIERVATCTCVDIRLRPAWPIEQLRQQIPVHTEVLIVLATLLDAEDLAILPESVNRVILAKLLVVIRLKRQGTAVQVGIVLHDAFSVSVHRGRIVDMLYRQPHRVPRGNLYLVEDTIYALHCIIKYLASMVDGLIANGAARLLKHIVQRTDEDNGGKEHDPQAEPDGKQLADIINGVFHHHGSYLLGTNCSYLISRSIILFSSIRRLACFTMSGRRRNSRFFDSRSICRRSTSFSISF